MKTIHIYSGLPASGKTTLINTLKSVCAIHRDEVRATLRGILQSDEYFPVSAAKEYDIWTNILNNSLKLCRDTDLHIDQTTLTISALDKLLNALRPNIAADDKIIVHVLLTPSDVCIDRNDARKGFEHVPTKAMLSMSTAFYGPDGLASFSTRGRYNGFNLTVVRPWIW